MSDKNFKVLIWIVSSSIFVIIGLYIFLTFKAYSDLRNDFDTDRRMRKEMEEAMREMEQEWENEQEDWELEVERELQEAMDSMEFSD